VPSPDPLQEPIYARPWIRLLLGKRHRIALVAHADLILKHRILSQTRIRATPGDPSSLLFAPLDEAPLTAR